LAALGKRSIDQRLKTTRQIRPARGRAGTREAAETAGFPASGLSPAGAAHVAADEHPGVKIDETRHPS